MSFLQGFAETSGAPAELAAEVWQWFSELLPARIRERFEREGYESGRTEGEAFKKFCTLEEFFHARRAAH
jgi:hypothetical protein